MTNQFLTSEQSTQQANNLRCGPAHANPIYEELWIGARYFCYSFTISFVFVSLYLFLVRILLPRVEGRKIHADASTSVDWDTGLQVSDQSNESENEPLMRAQGFTCIVDERTPPCTNAGPHDPNRVDSINELCVCNYHVACTSGRLTMLPEMPYDAARFMKCLIHEVVNEWLTTHDGQYKALSRKRAGKFGKIIGESYCRMMVENLKILSEPLHCVTDSGILYERIQGTNARTRDSTRVRAQRVPLQMRSGTPSPVAGASSPLSSYHGGSFRRGQANHLTSQSCDDSRHSDAVLEALPY